MVQGAYLEKGSAMSLRRFTDDVNWGSERDITSMLQTRFAASSLPFEVRLRLYTELMMILSGEGLLFAVSSENELERLKKGLDSKAIQAILIPETEYH